MQAEAKARLQAEMDAAKNDRYVNLIGKFLQSYIEANPDQAAKIIADGKTIAKSLDAMKAEARKQQHNGMSMLTDEEGFSVVLKYFGIDGTPSSISSPAVPASVPAAAIASSGSAFNISLDEFGL